MLERQPELEALGEAVARTREGAGRAILIEAPAGLGKSRLLASTCALAAEAGLQVCEARGAVREREFAFGVARQLFEQPVSTASEAESGALFSGAAELARRMFGHEGVGLVPQDADAVFGALHGLYWLTVNLTDRGPLLLAVDDAHWADASSLQFLGYLLRRLGGMPVLLVAAARTPDPDGDSLWEELADDPAAETLRLRALTEAAAREVLTGELDVQADDEFVAACHRATGGNPLFLRELVAAVRDSGLEPTADAAATVTAVGPPAVGRFVLHRLQRLGPSAIELARSVAVLGDASDLTLAARMAGLEPGDARRVADVLVQADVFAPTRGLGFVHPIVEAAIYEELLPGDRDTRHRTAARLLDEAGAPVERVATHVLQSRPAGDPRSVAILREAALTAAERGAPTASVTYLRRALEEPPDARERGSLLCELGRVEITQNREVGYAHLLEALETPGDVAVQAESAVWLGRAAITLSRADWAAASLAAIDPLLATADETRSLELEAEALNVARLELSLRDEVPDRLARFERRAARDARFERIARIQAASERMLRGAPAAEVADVVEAALDAGPPTDPYAFGIAIEVLVKTERDDAAVRWLEPATDAARAYGLGLRLAALLTQRALLELGRGAVGAAEVDIQTALRLAGERHFMLPRIVAVAITVALERGELQTAMELADRYGEGLARERAMADEYLISRGRLRVALGDIRDGLADFLRCGELLDSYGIVRPTDWRSDAARALVELDDRERAEELAREGLSVARAFGPARALTRSLRAAGRVIGGAEGLALLEEAVYIVEQTPSRLDASYALADLGVELVERRRRREGREALRLALELALKCGAAGLCERIRGDLGAGGGRPARLELSGIEALTPAERKVCDLAASELTNRQIAQNLFVTEKTVELHLTSAYRKLGIRSRFQLAAVMPSAEPAKPG